MEPLMTTEEVADFLRVDVVTVRRLVNRGELLAYRVGSEYRFRASNIESYLQQQYASRNQGGDFSGKGDRFEKFSEPARRILQLAQEEAERLQHSFIGTEHLLLGLLDEGEGVAVQVLRRMELDLNAVRERVEYILNQHLKGSAESPLDPHEWGTKRIKETIASLKKATARNARCEQGQGRVGMTPRAKKVFELAVDEAMRMGQKEVGTEHILLGLIREGNGIGADVLVSFGVNLKQVRTLTLEILSRQQSATVSSSIEVEPQVLATDDIRWLGERFEKFTERAQQALKLAQEEARQFQHNYIGTEHILLGLLEGENVASQVLRKLGVELDAVWNAIGEIVGRGDSVVVGEIGLTGRAKKVIELAFDEARRLKHDYVGTEHLLLGLIREGEGIAADMLEKKFGLKLDQVRAAVLEKLNTPESTKADPVSEEPQTLVAEGEKGLTCSNCGARSPEYFQYCFQCGNKLG